MPPKPPPGAGIAASLWDVEIGRAAEERTEERGSDAPPPRWYTPPTPGSKRSQRKQRTQARYEK